MPTKYVRPALQLGAISVSDADALNQILDTAEAGLQHALAQSQTLLRSRDLSGLWDNSDHCWKPGFEPLAVRIAHLQSALRVLADEPDQPTGLDVLRG